MLLWLSSVENKERPSIGLLNIGEEEIKGNEVVKQAAELLRDSGLNFYGNIEGNDIYKGTTDVVVCDGFVGNVALENVGGRRANAFHLSSRGVQTQSPHEVCGAHRLAGHQGIQASRGSSPLQWRQSAGIARHCH